MRGIYFLISAIIMLMIFYFSNIPNLHVISDSQVPIWWKKLIKLTYIKIGSDGFFSYSFSLHPNFIIHKIGHIVFYGLLGIAIFLATNRSLKWAVIIAAIFALSDEIHQGFVQGRSSRFFDILLDVTATITFAGIFKYLKKKQKKKPRKLQPN
ncbi:VanZ family protein [Dendrosporobacter sp. 1207_IL3150]|uniref:VanZ family protein n=1 Tax=Dendrosporobacter sp. 1207_IL3150 TaxID=3084054 RepID=UPI002FD9F6BB